MLQDHGDVGHVLYRHSDCKSALVILRKW